MLGLLGFLGFPTDQKNMRISHVKTNGYFSTLCGPQASTQWTM